MKLQPIVDRLAGLGLAYVGGVLEYVALKQIPGQLPAAYVVPQDEATSGTTLDGGTDQRVMLSFAVMLILDGNARREAAVSEQLERYTAAIKTALVGWSHPEASRPTAYAGGSLVGAEPNALVWACRFRAPYHLRKVS